MAKKATKKATPSTQPKAKEPDKRSTTWATLIYPESAPKDFLEKLRKALVDGYLSPLHNDPVEEEQMAKKDHYHLLIRWETKKSPEQARELFDLVGGVGTFKVFNFRRYARYLCHLDDPEKKQYNPADVVELGCMDYLDTIECDSDRDRIVAEMMEFCDQNPELVKNSFARLSRYARNEKPEWFRHLVRDSARVMTDYLRALQWEKEQEEVKKREEELRDRLPVSERTARREMLHRMRDERERGEMHTNPLSESEFE